MEALDLYAKIEPLIGFYEEYDELYSRYLEILDTLHVKSILDIGCGNGKFLQRLKKAKYNALGIDRSQEMISTALSLGVKAKKIELCDLVQKFDCATAVGDVLNYLPKDELKLFFEDLHNVLKKDAYFIADINTLCGFQDVADGLLLKDDKKQFLAIEANFQYNQLTTHITLFENHNKYFKKFSNQILQYYYPIGIFENIEGFKLIKNFEISMFGEFDKTILIFKKSN